MSGAAEGRVTGGWPLWIIVSCVAVAALRLGRHLLIPVAQAVLSALLLSGIGSVLSALAFTAALTLLLLAAEPPTLARITAPGGTAGRTGHVLQIIDAIRVEVGRYYGTLAEVVVALPTLLAARVCTHPGSENPCPEP